MDRILQTCLYCTDIDTGTMIRQGIDPIHKLRLAKESTDLAQICVCAKDGSIDLLLVGFGPNVEKDLESVRAISQAAPDLGIIGLSPDNNPHTIIAAMRAGCMQFVSLPIEEADIAEAIDRIESSLNSIEQSSKQICIMGSTGGVGGTTISCNLAYELARHSTRPCALVDLDLDFGDVAESLDAQTKYTLADLCVPSVHLDEDVIRKAIHEMPGKVHLLARPNDLGQAHAVCTEGVSDMLSMLSNMYSYVVVDVPRSFTNLNVATIQKADLVLIVSQLRVASVRNAHRAYELLMQMGADEDRIHLVLNRYNADHEHVTSADVERNIGQDIFAKVPNDYRNVNAALDVGQPIYDKSPKSPARVAIQQLACRIADGGIGPVQDTHKSRGFLGRLLAKK